MGRKQTEAAVDEYGFKRNYVDEWGDGSRERRDERTLITSGNWVMVIKSLPVAEYAAPQLYGIYWAVPFVREGKAATKDKLGNWSGTEIKTLVGVDEYGRQCAKIYTPHEVSHSRKGGGRRERPGKGNSGKGGREKGGRQLRNAAPGKHNLFVLFL